MSGSARQLGFGGTLALLLFALLIAIPARFAAAHRAVSPLNDGGLFTLMAEELQANHFRPPRTTGYNQDGIPFCYPPLGIYALGLSSSLLGQPVLKVDRFLPPFVAVMVVLAFALVAREFFRNDGAGAAFAATAVYCFNVTGYDWLIMGGGATRAFGVLFALLAVLLSLQWVGKGGILLLIACGALIALAGCSHLEAGIFAAYSVALFVLARPIGLARKIADLAIIGVCAVILSAPWWLGMVLLRHGFAPLHDAMGAGGSLYALMVIANYFALSFSEQHLLSVFVALGLFYCLIERRPVLPIWILLAIVFTSRSAPMRASVPMALLAGMGWLLVVQVVRWKFPESSQSSPWRPRLLTGGLMAFFLTACIVSSHFAPPGAANEGLSQPAIDAMRWACRETPPDSSFAVVSDTGPWVCDSWSEWFPYYAQRKSLYTVQGSEWLPHGEFSRRKRISQSLLQVRTLDDLNAVFQKSGALPTHILVARETREGFLELLVKQLQDSHQWTLQFQNEAAAIFKRVGPAGSTVSDSSPQSRLEQKFQQVGHGLRVGSGSQIVRHG